MARLSVNIDHVATVRQARRIDEPDPVAAAALCELAGAAGITIHLREDRRHIQDRDLRVLRETVRVPLNLEMAATDEMVAIALDARPHHVTFVPEGRHEVTTEGGLDVAGQRGRIADVVARLQGAGIGVSLFIDPDPAQVAASAACGAGAVELHTGEYAAATLAHDDATATRHLQALRAAGREAIERHGLVLHAGHGLNYRNVGPVAAIDGVCDLNIGHAIVARAILVGMERAVREMIALIASATGA